MQSIQQETKKQGSVVLREGPVHRHLILIESGDVEAIHFGPKDAVHPLGRSIAEACAVLETPLLRIASRLLMKGSCTTVWYLILEPFSDSRSISRSGFFFSFFLSTLEPRVLMQKSISLTYEPASEWQHIVLCTSC